MTPNPVRPATMLTGTLTVMNTGAAQLLGVTAEVFIPDEIVQFNANLTSGATVSCSGDAYPALCAARERVVYTVGMLGPGAMALLTLPPPVANTVTPGRVVSFNARAADGSGFTANARASVGVRTP